MNAEFPAIAGILYRHAVEKVRFSLILRGLSLGASGEERTCGAFQGLISKMARQC
jgi:hypothetical protein